MEALGVFEQLQPKIVQGQNIGQAFQFVATGNAEMGFVALGQVSQSQTGSRWIVPQEYYKPLRQNAVLLATGADNPAASAFLEFLRGEEASAIIEKFGYALDR
jgi:molybdate transport system substrate-binding protein